MRASLPGLGLAALVVLSWALPAAAQTAPGEYNPDPLPPSAYPHQTSDNTPARPDESGPGGTTPHASAIGSCQAIEDIPTVGVGPTSIVPDDCWGRFPSSRYDIGCDEGAWNNISRKVYCTFTDLSFQAARSTTSVSLWLIRWTYGFGVYQALGDPMIAAAATYQHQIIEPLGLVHVAWFYAIAWCAIAGLRGRLTLAAGELATSIVLAGLAGILLANPAGYLHGAFDTMSSLSGALLSTGTGQPPPSDTADAQALLAPLQAELHKAFVEDPYDYLDWGGALSGACAAAREEILADGPHGTDDEPRHVMADAGCQAQADFNHDPTGQRLFGAVLTLIATLVMAALIALVAGTILTAQIVAVVLFAVAPFAALGAVLTGGGRELAWRWVAALARVGIVVIGMSFVLSLLLLGIRALLATGDSDDLIERFMLVNLVVIAAFIARKRLVTAGGQLANQLGARLAGRRADGQHAQPWLGPAALGGISGFALGSSLGIDPRSRTGRLVSFATRDHMADRRLRRHYKRSERRAQQPVARERTELTVNAHGELVERHSLSVDGPAIPPRADRTLPGRIGAGRSVRARWARHAVEAQARRRATELPRRAGWTTPPDLDYGDPGPIDPEEA
jgi:hypothetical protein